MSSDRSADATIEAPYVSTGRLPSPDIVRALVSDAHERFGSNRDGTVSDVYPALAQVPQDLFGLCVVGVNGATYASGDWDILFSIMSVSKPFVFALVLQVPGADATRRRLGVNATGLPFNSLAAVERSEDGLNESDGQLGRHRRDQSRARFDARRTMAVHYRGTVAICRSHAAMNEPCSHRRAEAIPAIRRLANCSAIAGSSPSSRPTRSNSTHGNVCST